MHSNSRHSLPHSTRKTSFLSTTRKLDFKMSPSSLPLKYHDSYSTASLLTSSTSSYSFVYAITLLVLSVLVGLEGASSRSLSSPFPSESLLSISTSQYSTHDDLRHGYGKVSDSSSRLPHGPRLQPPHQSPPFSTSPPPYSPFPHLPPLPSSPSSSILCPPLQSCQRPSQERRPSWRLPQRRCPPRRDPQAQRRGALEI